MGKFMSVSISHAEFQSIRVMNARERELAQETDRQVAEQKREALDPNTSPEKLLLLCIWHHEEVARNPALPLLAVENPVLYKSIIDTIATARTTGGFYSIDDLNQIAHQANYSFTVVTDTSLSLDDVEWTTWTTAAKI